MNGKNYHNERRRGSCRIYPAIIRNLNRNLNVAATIVMLSLISYLLSPICLYPASETSNWQSYPKWLTGSSTLGNWQVKGSSTNIETFDGSNWVIKISTENPPTAFFPGRDYYYLYQTTTTPSTLVWDQRERGKSQDTWQPWKSERKIYLPILGIELILPNGTTYYPLNDYTLWYGSYSVDSGYRHTRTQQ